MYTMLYICYMCLVYVDDGNCNGAGSGECRCRSLLWWWWQRWRWWWLTVVVALVVVAEVVMVTAVATTQLASMISIVPKYIILRREQREWVLLLMLRWVRFAMVLLLRAQIREARHIFVCHSLEINKFYVSMAFICLCVFCIYNYICSIYEYRVHKYICV